MLRQSQSRNRNLLSAAAPHLHAPSTVMCIISEQQNSNSAGACLLSLLLSPSLDLRDLSEHTLLLPPLYFSLTLSTHDLALHHHHSTRGVWLGCTHRSAFRLHEYCIDVMFEPSELTQHSVHNTVFGKHSAARNWLVKSTCRCRDPGQSTQCHQRKSQGLRRALPS